MGINEISEGLLTHVRLRAELTPGTQARTTVGPPWQTPKLQTAAPRVMSEILQGKNIMHVCMYVCKHVCACVCVCVYVCMYACMCLCRCMLIWVYTYTHMHTRGKGCPNGLCTHIRDTLALRLLDRSRIEAYVHAMR